MSDLMFSIPGYIYNQITHSRGYGHVYSTHIHNQIKWETLSVLQSFSPVNIDLSVAIEYVVKMSAE